MTLYLARFDEPVTLDRADTGSTVGDPMAWIVGADNIGAGTPLGSPRSTVWLALGLHADEESARTEFDAGVDAVPCMAEAGETWAAILEPIGHRGEVNWLDNVQPGQVSATESRRPEGSFVVVTSVGWTFDERFDSAKAMDFARGVELVRASMDDVDGLHSQQSFSSQ